MKSVNLTTLIAAGTFFIAGAANAVSVVQINSEIERCYQQTVGVQDKVAPETLSTRACSKLVKYDEVSRDTKSVAYFNRAVVHQHKGNHEKAARDFASAVKLNADVPQGHAAAAQAFANINNLDMALYHYDLALELDSDNALLLKKREGVAKQLKHQLAMVKVVKD